MWRRAAQVISQIPPTVDSEVKCRENGPAQPKPVSTNTTDILNPLHKSFLLLYDGKNMLVKIIMKKILKHKHALEKP